MTRPLIIAAAADDNYASGMSVTFFSALSTLSASKVLCCALDDNIEPTRKRKIERAAKLGAAISGCNVTLKWTSVSEDIANMPEIRHFSRAACARLLLARVLSDYDRCIYLDSDLLIRADLAELWETDLGDNIMAAVKGRVGIRGKALRTRLLGPDARADYVFNSSVLLLDLAAFRAEDLDYKSLDICRNHRNELQFVDQDALNIVCNERWLELDKKWMVPCKVDRIETVEKSAILHFSGKHKPWTPRGPRQTSELRKATRLYHKALVDCGFISRLRSVWLRFAGSIWYGLKRIR